MSSPGDGTDDSLAVPPRPPSKRKAALAAKAKLQATGTSSRSAIRALLPASERGFLRDLPLHILEVILRKAHAGPRDRLTCKAFAELPPCVLSLTPNGISKLRCLLDPLKARYASLTSLNLQLVDAIPFRNATLRSVATALPSLCALCLPPTHTLTPAGLTAAARLLRHLTSIDIPSSPAPANWTGLCSALHHLHALEHVALPLAALPAAAAALPAECAGVSRLDFAQRPGDDADDVSMEELEGCAERLPALVEIHVDCCTLCPVLEHALTPTLASRLTALKLWGLETEHTFVFRSIGALTALRSLQLRVEHPGCLTAQDVDWLVPLTLLTRLDLTYEMAAIEEMDNYELMYDNDNGERYIGIYDAVASAVPQMPALRELRIVDSEAGDGHLEDDLGAAAMQQITAAADKLQRLHLGLLLHNAKLELALPALTALTAIRLEGTNLQSDGYEVLTGLPALRELGVHGAHAEALPTCELIASLPNLDTLLLTCVYCMPGAYLAGLCGSAPQLRALDLSCDLALGQCQGAEGAAGVGALWQLTNLEILDMSRLMGPEVLAAISAPASLRHCYLPASMSAEERGMAKQVLGLRPYVWFRRWELPGRGAHTRLAR